MLEPEIKNSPWAMMGPAPAWSARKQPKVRAQISSLRFSKKTGSLIVATISPFHLMATSFAAPISAF